MAKSDSKFYVGLIKPHEGVIFSPQYERNVTIHGPYQLYTDLLDVDKNSVILVLAALRDGDIVKLSPEKSKNSRSDSTMTILTQEESSTESLMQEQLKITIDGEFVKRFMSRSKLDRRDYKLNLETLEMRNVMCCYFTIEERNNIKVKSLREKAARKMDARANDWSTALGIPFPGEKVDFLKDYDNKKSKKQSVIKKICPFDSEMEESNPVDHKSFYDMDGHKHIMHEREKLRQKEQKRGKKWWNRLSEPRVRLIANTEPEESAPAPEITIVEEVAEEIEDVEN